MNTLFYANTLKNAVSPTTSNHLEREVVGKKSNEINTPNHLNHLNHLL